MGIAAASGAVSGAITGSGVGIFGAIVGNAAVGGGSYIASQLSEHYKVTPTGLAVSQNDPDDSYVADPTLLSGGPDGDEYAC